MTSLDTERRSLAAERLLQSPQASAAMASLTPIRVRGKYGGTPAEKRRAGKLRQRRRETSVASTPPGSSRTGSLAPTGTRKRRARELSRLEQLPTEILQDIFVYSANINLPLASLSLQEQLSSTHVYLRLTSCLLRPIVGFEQEHRARATDANLSAATRLLNARFMTPMFFRAWLEEERQLPEHQHRLVDTKWRLSSRALWQSLGPSTGLLPPSKIFRAPYSEAKVELIRVFSFRNERLIKNNPDYAAIVYGGLSQAVAGAHEDAIMAILDFGVRPDTEIVRKAVIDSACSPHVIKTLVTRGQSSPWSDIGDDSDEDVEDGETSATVDFLDPVLWSWAEKNYAGRGKWLVKMLKRYGR
jgi:hypothetical protein